MSIQQTKTKTKTKTKTSVPFDLKLAMQNAPNIIYAFTYNEYLIIIAPQSNFYISKNNKDIPNVHSKCTID